MILRQTLLVVGALALSAAAVQAGDRYLVTIEGEVEFNQVTSGPLSNLSSGDAAVLSFELDADEFTNSPAFPTRGYVIDQTTWSYTFDGFPVPLQTPFPAAITPYFVIRDDDPAVDGFFISRNVNVPQSLPLNAPGAFGPFGAAWSVTYDDDPLPSLDLADAVGSYDFAGLTVFNWLIDDGPFEPVGMIFERFTIEAIDVSPWTDQGNALPGVSGPPRLFGSGPLSAGSPNSIVLSNAAPSATMGLFLATASNPVPFKGGTLMPVPFLDPLIFTSNPAGAFPIPFTMPSGFPPGTEIWVQWAIQDAAAVNGVALSNAVRGVTP